MMYPIDVYTWKILRAILRNTTPAGQEDVPTGMEIYKEVGPNRKWRYGLKFEEMARLGLVRIVGNVPDPDKWNKTPRGFLNKYVLTAAGHHAAEYGEYNADPDNDWRALGESSPARDNRPRSNRQKGMDTVFAKRS